MSTSRVMMAIPPRRNDHKPRPLTSRQILRDVVWRDNANVGCHVEPTSGQRIGLDSIQATWLSQWNQGSSSSPPTPVTVTASTRLRVWGGATKTALCVTQTDSQHRLCDRVLS